MTDSQENMTSAGSARELGTNPDTNSDERDRSAIYRELAAQLGVSADAENLARIKARDSYTGYQVRQRLRWAEIGICEAAAALTDGNTAGAGEALAGTLSYLASCLDLQAGQDARFSL